MSRLRLLVLLFGCVPWAEPASAQDEGEQRLVVRGLSFEGNEAIDDQTLRSSIATSQSAFFARFVLTRWTGLGAKRYLNETEFRRDVQRILGLYRASGFVNVQVDTTVRRTDAAAYIRFAIDEGRPVRVTELTVTGIEGILDPRRLRERLPLRVGAPFNRMRFLAAADTIAKSLRDVGYPFVDVFRAFDEDREALEARVEFTVEPGALATVDSVVILGAQEIEESVIRRLIAVRPGRRYRERELTESQLDLYRMNTFNFVSFGLRDSLPEGPADSSVTVELRVTEAPLRRIRAGAGYGTVDCFRALGSWTVQDFLGGARTFTLSGQLSQIGAGDPLGAGFETSVCPALADEDPSRLKLNYNLTASLREPIFFSRRMSATLAFTLERHSEFQAFLREAVGADFSITRQTRWRIPVTASYSISYGRTTAEPAIFCSFLNVCRVEDTRVFTERLRRATFGVSVARNRANSLLDPTRGTVVRADVRHASDITGSDSLVQFTKSTAEFASYHPIGRRSTFAWRVRVGAIAPHVAPSAGGERFVPPEERFYGGGPTTVRGFSQNEMGPLVRVLNSTAGRDTAGADTVFVDGQPVAGELRTSPTGGRSLLVMNAELRFPIPGLSNRLSGGVFVDMGQIGSSATSAFDLGDLRITPGFGLRLVSPLGPIRLDVGFNPHDPRAGPVFQERDPLLDEPRELRDLGIQFAPDRGFFDRIRIHFSIGQAF